jgi:hypothetical protein
MPLQLPDLDDRRYNDLVAEALARIPTDAPDWTNHNPSDPGVTLIELFAYLTDMLLYRLNRVTDDNTRKFLKLLNAPRWETGDLGDETRNAVFGVRERYRAVTKDDYEFLSSESFNAWLIEALKSSVDLASVNLVARAHCVPQRDLEAGTEAGRLARSPEHVSVVIVPAAKRPNLTLPPATVPAMAGDSVNPQPSTAQMSALLSFLDERRMLTTRLHVVGPFYVHVTTQLLIGRNADAVEKDLTEAIGRGLAGLLNPLPSARGEGWPFGRDVFASDIYGALEKIPGLDFVADVMLDSRCAPDDNKCVVASSVWHADGDFIGLTIEDHHLPVFESADVVIAASAAFVAVNLFVSARAAANADLDALKRVIKATVRRIFHPGLDGPRSAADRPADVFVSDIEAKIKAAAGLTDPVSVVADCVPASILKTDHDRGPYIHFDAGRVADWRTTIHLN